MVCKFRTGISWHDLPGPPTGRGRRSAPASAATRSTACSPGLCGRVRPRRTPPVTLTGWSRSAPPSSAPTSTPPPPAEQGATPVGRSGRSRLGRSRGGLTTKAHLVCDGRGRPRALLITPARCHDSPCAQPLLERIRVSRTGPGRPRRRPDYVTADKAYSSRGSRGYLR
ncbi:transposase [Streptomyces caniferus]|uniref:transposase n=1 Tax=Streptomyces caniferus TaxID=285557 RepID=UPI00372069C3